MPANKSDLPAAKLHRTIYRELKSAAVLPFAAPVPTDQQISDLIRRWQTNDVRFARAIESDIDFAVAMDGLAIRLCQQNQNADALELLCASAALKPATISTLNNLAVVLERLDRTADAISCVQQSLHLSPLQNDSWIFLATLKRKQDDLAGARQAYETALQQQPIAPLAWQGLGLILQEQQKPFEAITCLLKCLEQNHATPPVLAILGQLFYITGQFQKSFHAYAAALEGDPSHLVYRQMRDELQFVCSIVNGEDLSKLLEGDAHRSDEQLDHLLHKTFALLSAYGHKAAAIRVAEKRVELFPNSATAAYLLHAIHGDASVSRSPDAYLIESFNKHAGRFDDHLVKTLGYEIPEKLASMVAGLIPAGARVELLDAGCGTGLCGPYVRSFCASVTGVDVAEKMLEQAGKRGVYDRLVCAELTQFLNASPNAFDVIIAADVMIYFGDLSDLSIAIAAALGPGGLIAFSIERAAIGYQLLTSGRFAHDPAYIRQIFSRDFAECVCQETHIRLEGANKVAGNIFIFRRK